MNGENPSEELDIEKPETGIELLRKSDELPLELDLNNLDLEQKEEKSLYKKIVDFIKI
jgi:hypothetical protein